MNESAPQRPKEKSEEALLSRRRLLGGAAAFAGSALLGSYLLTKDNGADEDRINELDPPSPSPEKLSELTLVRNNIRTRVESIRKRSFMEKPNRGKNMLNNSVLNPDYASVAIVVEENGVLRLLHLQNVRQLSKQTRNGAGSGVYTHLEGGTKYQIALEDTVVDIGVSNRFSVRKQSEGENSTLPVHAVKRSRYEKEHVANKVIDKNGKEKVVKEVLGDYVGYVTYIPPASHLTHKESISSGKEYVDTVLESAYTVLSHRMTKSNQKVLGLCRDICRRLAVIEHVDPNVIIRAEAKKSGETETHTEARKRSIYQ